MFKKIVTMGGGTGTFTVLQGLKKYNVDLTAIVTMTDDGGSSGILRDELGVLPPGDLRQSLVALSESSQVMRDLFNYRFSKGKLKGHSLGNLLISALEKQKGGLDKALPYLNKILALRGQVIPISFDKVKLGAELENGQVIIGESKLEKLKSVNGKGIKRLFIQPQAQANSEALEAIKKADLIIIGPGSLYGSLLPLFLVQNIKKALQKTKAKIIYNVNLMTKHGHTDNFNIYDFIEVLENYLGKDIIDYVIFNNKRPPKKLLDRYTKEGEIVRFPSRADFRENGKIFIGRNLISQKVSKSQKGDHLKRSLIRHDSDKLAKVILSVKY
jgi:uncharacterized cofD-like protein